MSRFKSASQVVSHLKIYLFTCNSSFFHCPCKFHPQEAPASRVRRTLDESKTSCLLHLHADHLYYKRFKSVEAVVAQVTDLLSLNIIYRGLPFTRHDISYAIHFKSFLNHDFIFS